MDSILYGNVKVNKGYCEECEVDALIDNQGNLLCCGDPATSTGGIASIRREVVSIRKYLTKKQREKIIESQGRRCFYCNNPFGEIAYNTKRNKFTTLIPHIDHVCPFLLGGSMELTNLVAACQICNKMKKAKVRKTLEEFRSYLQDRWEIKGYVVTSSEEDNS